VDDVGYFDEPMFEDGVVADAIDQVVARRVAYFSAAGNEARQSYTAPFRPSGRKGLAGVRHDFDPGPGVADLQRIVAPAGTISLLASTGTSRRFPRTACVARKATSMQSSTTGRYPRRAVHRQSRELVCQEPGIANNIGGDAVELPVIVNLSNQDLQVQLGIEWVSDPRRA